MDCRVWAAGMRFVFTCWLLWQCWGAFKFSLGSAPFLLRVTKFALQWKLWSFAMAIYISWPSHWLFEWIDHLIMVIFSGRAPAHLLRCHAWSSHFATNLLIERQSCRIELSRYPSNCWNLYLLIYLFINLTILIDYASLVWYWVSYKLCIKSRFWKKEKVSFQKIV